METRMWAVTNQLRDCQVQDGKCNQTVGTRANLLKIYSDIVEEEEQCGFVEKILGAREIHYIPHHPVHRDSSTAPICIVFDCSCEEKSGTV